MNAKEYLLFLQQRMLWSKYGLTLTRKGGRSREEALEWIRRARSAIKPILPTPGMKDEELMEMAAINNVVSPLESIAAALVKDASQFIPEADTAKFKETIVGFLPTGIINACCIGGPFNGYIVAINYGLYFSFRLLNLAIIGPHVTGDLQHAAIESVYPDDIFQEAVNCALQPSIENYQRISRHLDYMPPELLGLAAPGISSMLSFILLHEFGHISNGDVDKGFALARFDLNDNKLHYTNASRRREYRADRYALNVRLREPSDSVSAWARFAWVEALFQFFLRVERKRSSQTSQSHPPAASRLRALRRLMEEQWGEDNAGFTKRIGIDFTIMEHGSLKKDGS